MDQQLSEVQEKMRKAVEILRTDLSSIRTGRATPSLIENIIISAYEDSQKLKIMEMGTITASDPRTLIIQPWDQNVALDIVRGILKANIGLTPTIDGAIIRITIPPLTEERRREYVRLLKQKLEAGRVMIRQIRHDKMIEFKRRFENDEITEDERKRLERELQRLTDESIAEIDTLGKEKEEELLQI